jgi:hypothetical protein
VVAKMFNTIEDDKEDFQYQDVCFDPNWQVAM